MCRVSYVSQSKSGATNAIKPLWRFAGIDNNSIDANAFDVNRWRWWLKLALISLAESAPTNAPVRHDVSPRNEFYI